MSRARWRLALTSTLLVGLVRIALAEARVLPVGVFYTSRNTDARYVDTVARKLKSAHFNTVVATETFTKETIDVFQKHGIAVVSRNPALMAHPGVTAGWLGTSEQPGTRADFAALKAQYLEHGTNAPKPFVTCLPGEEMGLYGPTDPRAFWYELRPSLRCFRWYGISRSHYGILHKPSTEGRLSMPAIMTVGAQARKTPYWVTFQAFGRNEHEAMYSNPSAAQIQCMMHLGLAYRARGILLWGLQNVGEWQCLLDEKTLQPTDAKFAAASKMAGLIAKHSDLLASLEHSGVSFQCPNPIVYPIPVKPGKDGKPAVYVVNRDTRNPAKATLRIWSETHTWTKATDVFAGTDLQIQPPNQDGDMTITLTLAPGEGKLITTDVEGKKKKKKKK